MKFWKIWYFSENLYFEVKDQLRFTINLYIFWGLADYLEKNIREYMYFRKPGSKKSNRPYIGLIYYDISIQLILK